MDVFFQAGCMCVCPRLWVAGGISVADGQDAFGRAEIWSYSGLHVGLSSNDPPDSLHSKTDLTS